MYLGYNMYRERQDQSFPRQGWEPRTRWFIPHLATVNALPGKFLKIPERRVKAQKQGYLTIGGAFICRNMIG